MTVYILLPCYNEESNLRQLVDEISQACHNLDYKIVAVDDGSRDGTYQLLLALSRTYPLIVLRHEDNKGLHEALRTLLLWTYKNAGESDYIIMMDSDLTHDPRYIPQLISACEEKEADVAIASRFAEGGKQVGVPLHRVLLSKGLRILVKITLGISVRDISSGYRCIRSANIKKIIKVYGCMRFIEAKGFDVQLDLLFKLVSHGARVVEIPFTLDYSKKGGRSKLKIFRTVLGYLQTILRLKRFPTGVREAS